MISSQLCNPDILESNPTTDLSSSSIFEIDNKDSIKTFALCWHPNKDGFGLNFKFCLNPIFTKRSILSTVACLFDPLGYLAPVIFAGKILLKDCEELNNSPQISATAATDGRPLTRYTARSGWRGRDFGDHGWRMREWRLGGQSKRAVCKRG